MPGTIFAVAVIFVVIFLISRMARSNSTPTTNNDSDTYFDPLPQDYYHQTHHQQAQDDINRANEIEQHNNTWDMQGDSMHTGMPGGIDGDPGTPI